MGYDGAPSLVYGVKSDGSNFDTARPLQNTSKGYIVRNGPLESISCVLDFEINYLHPPLQSKTLYSTALTTRPGGDGSTQ